MQDIELTHSRLRSLDALNLPRFAKTLQVRIQAFRSMRSLTKFVMQRLSFRQNLLTSLLHEDGTAPLESLTELEEIDLYDNRISKVKGLRNLSKLR